MKIVFIPPEPRVLNEAWGSMSLSQYEMAKREVPKWKFWVSCFCPLIPHPYLKYANGK